MSSSLVEDVVEPNIRCLGKGGVLLYLNDDASWSVGLNTNALSKVRMTYNGTNYASIDDSTFGYSAVAIEKASSGSGYSLYVMNDSDTSNIVEVQVDAAGNIDSSSLRVLTKDQIDQFETTYVVDLDDSGSVGGGLEVIDADSISLYESDDGVFKVGASAASAQSLTVNGQSLTTKVLPAGWSINKCVPTSSGYDVFATTSSGDLFHGQFNSSNAYVGGDGTLNPAAVAAKEVSLGVDLNGNSDLPATAGWTSVLQDSYIKSAVDSATASTGKMTYEQLVSLMSGIVQAHKNNSNAPVSAAEFADLQALASRGKNVFSGASDSSTDYLTYVFSKLVNGSPANEFYTGGTDAPVVLGNLAPNASLTTLERLVDKWLLGGDLPTPTAGGDAATGKASTTVATYAKSSGTLFVDGIATTDVTQGALGDCYMVASLVTIADVKSSGITSAVVDNGTVNGSHTWGIRFYDSGGKANWVTVNDMLPVSSASDPRLVFGGNSSKDLNGEIWVSLFEKAYAQANTLKILPRAEKSGLNAYYAVEGGFGDPIPELLGGGKINAYYYTNYNWDNNPYIINNVVDRNDPAALSALQTTVIKAMNDGKPIWISSGVKTTDSYTNTLLTGGHAFSAQDADKADTSSSGANVFNPWGIQTLPTPPSNIGHLSPFPYTVAELVGMPEVNFWIGI